MHKFAYHLENKSTENGRTIYNITFKPKRTEKLIGSFVLDSASLAFMKIQYGIYNVNFVRYRKIDSIFITSQYEQINHKWYLKNSHRTAYHSYKKPTLYTVDYVSTSIDSNNVKPFRYAQIIQSDDDNRQSQEIQTDSSQKAIFEKYVQQGQMHNFKIPEHTITSADSLSAGNQSLRPKPNAILSYLRGNNIRIGLQIGTHPLQILESSRNINAIARYGFGTELSFRIYKNIWIGSSLYNNYGIGHLNVSTANFYLSYVFKANTNHRPIYISPLIGYNTTGLELKSESLKYNYKSLTTGLKTSLELTHKKSIDFVVHYLSKKDDNNDTHPTKPTRFSFLIGYSL